MQLRHLVSMCDGVRYSHASLPWTGAARAYYATDRWASTLAHARIGTAPGTVWNYNDHAPTIVEVALARASRSPLLEFATETLFEPLGCPHAGAWTLDSAHVGLPNAAAGLYLPPRSLAAFGLAHLQGGRLAGRQVVPQSWVDTATRLTPADPAVLRSVPTRFFKARGMSYKYFWWIKERSDGLDDFVAIGNLGQFIYCAPSTRTVLVRTGRGWGRFGATNWLELLEAIAHPNSA